MKPQTTFAVAVLLLSWIASIGAQTDDYYFFDRDDIRSIRSAAATGWGQKIVASLENTVAERLKYPMEVPMLEGGHGHDYFCPEHNCRFSFEWDKPTAHYCRQCGRYRTHVNKYNWAWVNEVHNRNLSFLTACMYLYIITGECKYACHIRDMMLDYSLKYPAYMIHNRERKNEEGYSGKMFAQSLDESVWASYASKAYLVAKPVMCTEEIARIEQGYLQECAGMLLRRKAAGNWQVWHNSGLIALGIALGNDSIIGVALNDDRYGYHRLIDHDVRADGWWNEGSPIYHYYPLRAMMLSAEALRCRGINLYDDKLKKMLVAPATATYSNLQFPAHNDGWYGESLVEQAPLYEVACKRYGDDLFWDILRRCYKQSERTATDALLNNTNIGGREIPIARSSTDFEDTGFAVLCSGDKTVVLKYGPHGGLHGHPDKLSISIHDGQKEIVSDMGTPAYGVPDCYRWYRRTLSHSTLSVDMKDQEPAAGKLIKFEIRKNGACVEAESSDAYPGVYMSRKILLEGDRVTDVFTASSNELHTYDYVLILTEKPRFPNPGIPIVLHGSEAYSSISNAEARDFRKSVNFKAGDTDISVQLPAKEHFQLIVGNAPGIPPRVVVSGGDDVSFADAYPIIIRSTGKTMEIKTEFRL